METGEMDGSVDEASGLFLKDSVLQQADEVPPEIDEGDSERGAEVRGNTNNPLRLSIAH